jgi:hypothetical protein
LLQSCVVFLILKLGRHAQHHLAEIDLGAVPPVVLRIADERSSTLRWRLLPAPAVKEFRERLKEPRRIRCRCPGVSPGHDLVERGDRASFGEGTPIGGLVVGKWARPRGAQCGKLFFFSLGSRGREGERGFYLPGRAFKRGGRGGIINYLSLSLPGDL